MKASNSRVALILLASAATLGGSVALAAPHHPKKPRPSQKDKDAAAAKEAAAKAAADKAAADSAAADKGATDKAAATGSATTPTPTTPATAPMTGSGSAATSTEPSPKTEPVVDERGPDVDSFRQEYLALRDELFKSRARANTIASQLYSTRITIKFTWQSGRYYGVSKSSVRLDGATVFEDAGGAIAGDDGVRFDGYVAPGRHLVTFHVEATGKDDDAFSSTTESQIVVKAVAQQDLQVNAKAHDSGDIAYEWKRSEHGSYGLGIDVAVKSTKQPGAEAAAAPKGKK